MTHLYPKHDEQRKIQKKKEKKKGNQPLLFMDTKEKGRKKNYRTSLELMYGMPLVCNCCKKKKG